MSHSRKKLQASALHGHPILDPNIDRVAKVFEFRGANICEVEFPDTTRILVHIPSRFRKTVWIKRGNYVVVRLPTDEISYMNKVRGLVEHVLFGEQIKHLKQESLWPPEFEDEKIEEPQVQQLSSEGVAAALDGDSDEDADLADCFVNTNRRVVVESDDEEDEDED